MQPVRLHLIRVNRGRRPKPEAEKMAYCRHSRRCVVKYAAFATKGSNEYGNCSTRGLSGGE
jgi:hypothetical protein